MNKFPSETEKYQLANGDFGKGPFGAEHHDTITCRGKPIFKVENVSDIKLVAMLMNVAYEAGWNECNT